MKSILLLALLLSIGAASAISVSMNTNAGSISTSLEGGTDATITGSMLASEAGIFAGASGSGDVSIGQVVTGGGQSVEYAAQVGSGDLSSEAVATSGGVYGKMDYEGSSLLSPGEVATLAANPDLRLSKNALTKGGQVVQAVAGGTDITTVWYIDPAANFQIGFQNANYQLYDGRQISKQVMQNVLWTGQYIINQAANQQVIDGLYETGHTSFGSMDGYNTVMWDYFDPAYEGMTSTYYDASTRKVVESDVKLNAAYGSYYSTDNPNAQNNLYRTELHEMFHTAGLADATEANYGPYTWSTVMGTAAAPTDNDWWALWHKYVE